MHSITIVAIYLYTFNIIIIIKSELLKYDILQLIMRNFQKKTF